MNPFDAAKVMGQMWGQGAGSFLDAQRNLVAAMSQAMPQQAATAMPDMQAFQTSLAAFQRAWTEAQTTAATLATGLAGSAGQPDSAGARIMAKVFDPRAWLNATSEADGALGRMAEAPQLADLWGLERKIAAVTAAWFALRRHNLEHDTLMLAAWTTAVALFSETVGRDPGAVDPAAPPRDVTAIWVGIANDVQLDTQRSEAFLACQRNILKASTDLHVAQHALGEVYSEILGQPSRQEVDDVHKTLTELRREVRRLARERRPEPVAKEPEPRRSPRSKPAAPPAGKKRTPTP